MIAQTAQKQHAIEFQARYDELAVNLASFARKKGVGRWRDYRGNSSAEDPEDFAQDCLIEYWRTAKRNKLRTIQISLINRIARDRIVDAWRRQSRTPKRDEFELSTNQLTEQAGSPGEVVELQDVPLLRGLSRKAIEILALKHVADYLDREIADVMGMTVDGVRSSLKRSHKKMQDQACRKEQ